MSQRGKVWSKFTSKIEDGSVFKFRIEELSNDSLEDVIDLYVKYFATEETLCKSTGVAKNNEALKEYRAKRTYNLKHEKHQIDVCYLEHDDTSELVGASIMILEKKEKLLENKSMPFQLQTNEVKKHQEVVTCLVSTYDVMTKHDVDQFYDDKGIVVRPDYRGLGIAREFFRARRMICKEQGVPLTAAWVTSLGSQKAAERDDWETVYECNYEQFGRKVGVTFQDVPDSIKLMIARV